MTPQVQSWALDRSYGTDMPEAMRAFSGSSSAQLELSLGGTGGTTASALYGPWAPRTTGDVVRPRQSVTHAWGIGGSTIPAFRGTVRSRSAQSGTDTVKITALDGAERLRMAAELPRPAGGLNSATPYGPATNWVASPSWCVDHLLRRAGIHTAPPPRDGCILYASMHGGAAANIGYLKSLSGDWSRWVTTNAPHEIAVQGSTSGTYAVYDPMVRAVTRSDVPGLFYEAWVNDTGTGTRTLECSLEWVDDSMKTMHTGFVLDLAAGSITVATGRDPDPTKNAGLVWQEPDIPKQRGTWHVSLWLTFEGNGVPVYRPVVTAPSGSTYFHDWLPGKGTAVPASSLFAVRVGIRGLRAEAVQVSQLSAQPTGAALTQKGMWEKAADLDAPDIPLRVIPAVSGSAWDVITKIARATFSTAEFGADGIFRWRSRRRWANTPDSAHATVTAERELAALTVTEEIDACRNYCSVKWADWSQLKTTRSNDKVATNTIKIAPRSGQALVWTVGPEEFDVPPPVTYSEVLPDTIRFTLADKDNAPFAAGVVEVRTFREGGRLVLDMRNKGTAPVWLRAITTGLSLFITGPGLDSGEAPAERQAVAEDSSSQQSYGVQQYEHDPDGWIQDNRSAQAVADSLRDAGAYPVPLLSDVEILADPRIELGDVVRVRDSTGAALDTLAWVIGIRTSADSSGAVKQILTLRGTSYNGAPRDEGLHPDPPVDPNAKDP
ncbi:hypothetical protein I5Q34_19810 [Streptomyces sp. AV19]|uniref:hypothetical protein n=1 Tax=Streptomyces sp. AV19 TaxID=2793068 RepID=UPI0018FEE34A|nr:hypothetical protein [Streptomyces sp. AV19]MBH1936495.1 hypothetical protein [Streptomyces sp. AV19]MDG4532552.1 hypothetical protein [Streptomyces sp. AV19]